MSKDEESLEEPTRPGIPLARISPAGAAGRHGLGSTPQLDLLSFERFCSPWAKATAAAPCEKPAGSETLLLSSSSNPLLRNATLLRCDAETEGSWSCFTRGSSVSVCSLAVYDGTFVLRGPHMCHRDMGFRASRVLEDLSAMEPGCFAA